MFVVVLVFFWMGANAPTDNLWVDGKLKSANNMAGIWKTEVVTVGGRAGSVSF